MAVVNRAEMSEFLPGSVPRSVSDCKAQVNRRDPALGVVQKVLQLLFGEVGLQRRT